METLNKSITNVVRLICHDHPDAVLIEDSHAGDLICPECGLVVGDRLIDVGSEWRTFGAGTSDKDSADRCRVGESENALFENEQLSTYIGLGTGAASFDESGRAKYQSRNQMSSGNRLMLEGSREIKLMAERLNIPQMIVHRANLNFKQAQEKKTLKGRRTETVAAACIYIACRQEGVPRTFKEICAVSKSSKKEIGRVFKLVLAALQSSVELITSSDFMSRFCSQLGLPNSVQRVATIIAKRALDMEFVAGKSPISVGATAIFIATQEMKIPKTAKEIGEISGVAESTITSTYRALSQHLKQLVPEDVYEH